MTISCSKTGSNKIGTQVIDVIEEPFTAFSLMMSFFHHICVNPLADHKSNMAFEGTY